MAETPPITPAAPITEPVTGLTVELRPANGGDTYDVGVVVDGAWLAFGSCKARGFDEDRGEAIAAQLAKPEPESGTKPSSSRKR